MRFKLFLISLFCAMGILEAQDTIRSLIISEARIDNQSGAYVELTNVGTTAINLSQFEFGKIGPWTQPNKPNPGEWFMLPNKMLAPGKSFVMAKISDWVTKMWIKNPETYSRFESKPEFLKLADLQIHVQESPTIVSQSIDSVSSYASVVSISNGSYCWYLRHHVSPTDSVIVDQVGGVFDDSDGTGKDEMHDVAGISKATGNAVLIRKAIVTKGNPNFNTGRGTNAPESEWIVIPFLLGSWEPNRAVFWTVGNHGDYHLNSLTSSTIDVNWTDSILNVPWGIRNDDSIMHKFNRVPGIAWHYGYAKNRSDSSYTSVRNGDKLTVYACGKDVEKITFKINALPPTTGDNIVIPMKISNKKGYFRDAAAFCEVTDKMPGMDTIRGIPFACRKDTLLNYLEKSPRATWEFVLLGGESRADLKKGDILKITSEKGTAKQYYIKPNRYVPGHDASLSAITWPDIPASYRGKFGWKGDTIPNFISSKFRYKITVPWDYNGIPALVGKQAQINAKVQVTRAANLTGGINDRTITFTCSAEDDTTIKVYNVELQKEWTCCLPPQKWHGEPFISQYVFMQDCQNNFCEIVNPRKETLDISNYMITFGYYNSANEAITRKSGVSDWNYRYNKYIPGYKWSDSITWLSKPASLARDVQIDPIVKPGDVFVMADVFTKPTSATYPAFVIPQIDIDFNHNPWGEDLSNPLDAAMRQWWGQKIMLFKILNDSIKQGLKPANDPKDFELVDVMGDIAGSQWVIAGKPALQATSWQRKPNVYKGNPIIQASFGTTKENSEWINMTDIYPYVPIPWPNNVIMVVNGIGSHYLDEVTIYKSTVSSNFYRVTHGYSNNETIKGIAAGTTVNNFFANIIKADTGQHLKVKKLADGSIINGPSLLSNGDTLIVVSRDSVNSSKYILDLTPLSNDAKLTSTTYSITINGNTGIISNFVYSTDLKTVFEGVVVPVKASIDIIDAHGAYVPMKLLNLDSVYVYIKVNNQIKFAVTAEDGTTKITYQLQPNATDSDAFVTSNVYNVIETASLITSIPDGTSINSFYSNVIPAPGATMKVLDMYGFERKSGIIFKDDRLIVTAANGINKRAYYFIELLCGSYYPTYLESTDYNVDSVGLKISGNFDENTRVDTFLSKLVIVACEAKVYDKQGIEKSPTDYLAIGDKIKVTSCCGTKVVIYTIALVTSTQAINNETSIHIYPNPSIGNVFVAGLEPGNKIRVYNTLGELMLEKNALGTTETVLMNHQPNGVYFIKINIDGKQDVIRKIIINKI